MDFVGNPCQLSGRALGDALRAAMRAKDVTWTAVARYFNVSDATFTNWVDAGKINKPTMFKLREFFDGAVPGDHWEVPHQESQAAMRSGALSVTDQNLSLSEFISQVSSDFKAGLIDECDIIVLASMASHLATRKTVA